MRHLAILLLLSLLSTPALAHDQTLVGAATHSGGFAAPVAKFMQIDGQLGVFAGGRAGWIANHTVAVGIGGYTLVNDVNAQHFGPDSAITVDMAYGGLEIEYTFSPSRLIHFSVSTLIGAGGVDFQWDTNSEFKWDGDAFFIVEPAVNLEINVSDIFRITAGIAHCIVSGLEMEGLYGADISGQAAVVALRFGKF